jgi:hypothetical protein
LLEPFAIARLMGVYFKTIKDQQPNPEWKAKLEHLSAKFHVLKDRAFTSSTASPPESPQAL